MVQGGVDAAPRLVPCPLDKVGSDRRPSASPPVVSIRPYQHGPDPDRVIADYSDAIRLSPKTTVCYWNRGFAYERKADYDGAILDFTEAVRLNPGFGEAYHHRGLAYEKKGEKAKAEKDFAQAKKLGYAGK